MKGRTTQTTALPTCRISPSQESAAFLITRVGSKTPHHIDDSLYKHIKYSTLAKAFETMGTSYRCARQFGNSLFHLVHCISIWEYLQEYLLFTTFEYAKKTAVPSKSHTTSPALAWNRLIRFTDQQGFDLLRSRP